MDRLAQQGRTRDAAGAVVKTGAELFLDPQRRADIPDLIRLLENWTDSRIYSRYRSAALEGRADEAQFYLKLGEGIWEGKQLSNALRRIDSVSDDQISAFAKITDFRALIRAVYSVNAASAGTEASTREMPAATSTIQWQDMLFRQLGDNPLDQQRAKEAYQVLQAIDAERSLNYVWREYSEVLGSFCGLVLEFKTASALRQLLSTPTFMASFLDILSQDEALARKVMERLKEVPSRNPHKVVADILRDGKAQFETVSPSEPPTDSIVPAAVVGPSYQVRHVVVVGGNLGGKNGEKMRQTFPELKISHYPSDSGSAFSGKNISADTLVIFHIPGLGHSRMLRIEPQCRNAGALVAICPQPGVTSLINLIRHKLGIAAE